MYDEVVEIEFPLYLGTINLDVTFRLVGESTKDPDAWELRKINHWQDGDDLFDLLIYAETHKTANEIEALALAKLIEAHKESERNVELVKELDRESAEAVIKE